MVDGQYRQRTQEALVADLEAGLRQPHRSRVGVELHRIGGASRGIGCIALFVQPVGAASLAIYTREQM
jgi:hypothetical protein